MKPRLALEGRPQTACVCGLAAALAGDSPGSAFAPGPRLIVPWSSLSGYARRGVGISPSAQPAPAATYSAAPAPCLGLSSRTRSREDLHGPYSTAPDTSHVGPPRTPLNADPRAGPGSAHTYMVAMCQGQTVPRQTIGQSAVCVLTAARDPGQSERGSRESRLTEWSRQSIS